MIRILFIYGFGGSPKSTFCRLIKESLPKEEYLVLCPEYPQEDILQSRTFLKDYIERENINLIIGTSLGAFITLSVETSVPCIAINPCMMPSIELPLLKKRPGHPEDKEASKDMLQACSKIEEGVNKGLFNTSRKVVGLFALNDELLGARYKTAFKRCYGKADDIPGGHHGNSEAIPQIIETIKMFF